MNIFSFIIFSSIGIGIWNLTLIYLGYIIGDNLNLIGILIKKIFCSYFDCYINSISCLFYKKNY